jgi:transcription initiation factor TFIID subunit 11
MEGPEEDTKRRKVSSGSAGEASAPQDNALDNDDKKKRKVAPVEPAAAPHDNADEVDEEDDDNDDLLLPGMKKKRTKNAESKKAKEEAMQREQELMLAEATRLLQEHFSEAQQERYEAFRRSVLKEATVRKVMAAVTPLSLPKNTMVGVNGAAKLFVGELVEEARSVMDERGESGALRPWHVREAYLRLQQQGKTPLEPSVIPRGFSAKRNVL